MQWSFQILFLPSILLSSFFFLLGFWLSATYLFSSPLPVQALIAHEAAHLRKVLQPWGVSLTDQVLHCSPGEPSTLLRMHSTVLKRGLYLPLTWASCIKNMGCYPHAIASMGNNAFLWNPGALFTQYSSATAKYLIWSQGSAWFILSNLIVFGDFSRETALGMPYSVVLWHHSGLWVSSLSYNSTVPPLGTQPWEIKHICIQTCVWMFMVELFMIDK